MASDQSHGPSGNASSVAIKFYAAIAMFILLAAILLGSGIWSNKILSGSLEQIIHQDNYKSQLSLRVEKELLFVSRAEKSLILANSNVKREPLKKQISEHSDLIRLYADELIALMDESELEVGTVFRETLDKYLKVSLEVMGYVDAGKKGKAFRISNGKGSKILVEAEQGIKDIILANEEKMDASILSANTSNERLLMIMVVVAVAGTLVIGGFNIVIVRKGVIGPIKSLSGTMRELAAGDIQVEIPGLERSDELGEMASAVEVFKSSMIRSDKLAEEQKRHDYEERQRKEAELEEKQARADAERHKEQEIMQTHEARANQIDSLNVDFDENIEDVLKSVSSGVDQVKETANAMRNMADETTQMSMTVTTASDEAAQSVDSVANAAREMTVTINDVGEQADQAREISSNAVYEVNNASEQVSGLNERSQKIGDVLSLITDIADQTNLLALNATIEAARAGDAGKGFAVVAAEVKNLANQTAKATEEIGGQISSIQSATIETVNAIENIGQTVKEVNNISVSIAKAIEQQGIATQEIARNVEIAASGTQQVNQNISGVNEKADQSRTAANSVLEVANALGQHSTSMHNLVEGYLIKIKEA